MRLYARGGASCMPRKGIWGLRTLCAHAAPFATRRARQTLSRCNFYQPTGTNESYSGPNTARPRRLTAHLLAPLPANWPISQLPLAVYRSTRLARRPAGLPRTAACAVAAAWCLLSLPPGACTLHPQSMVLSYHGGVPRPSGGRQQGSSTGVSANGNALTHRPDAIPGTRANPGAARRCRRCRGRCYSSSSLHITTAVEPA